MKRLFSIMLMLCCLSGCVSRGIEDGAAVTDKSNDTRTTTTSSNAPAYGASVTDNGGEGSMDEKAVNREMIAQSLGIDESSRNIRFILKDLEIIGAGKIQKAVIVEIDNERAIDIVAEDGTNYRILLSKSGNVNAVINLDTGEWLICSIR